MSRLTHLLSAAAMLTTSSLAYSIESLGFELLDTLQNVEIRQYEEHVRATVRVDGDFEDAGSQAFRPLFDYISGENRTAANIEMTAPVIQEPGAANNQWLVSFVMPRAFDLDSLPVPSSDVVNVSEHPPMLMAALQYRGGWSYERYKQHEAQLMQSLEDLALKACGDPRWARHDPPFMPWFMRKNEILVPLCDAPI